LKYLQRIAIDGGGWAVEVSRIRIIPNDASIWLIYAGVRRRYFELFQETQRIFLELPGFSADAHTFQSEEQVRRHLAMSDQVRRFVRGAIPEPPSRTANDYDPTPYEPGTPDAKSFSAEVGNILRLYVEAKPGDLVLSPPVGHFDPMLIGEIETSWSRDDDLQVFALDNELVPARKVKWLDVALARRDFPPRVSKRVQNQLAITLFDAEYYDDIYRTVYPSYIWAQKSKSKIDIFGDRYSSSDPLQPYESALLIKYVISSAFAFEAGRFDEFQDLDVQTAIAAFYDERAIEHFRQNFNSPGKFSLIVAAASLSMLVAAGMVVATGDPAANFDTAKSNASASVSLALVGPGQAEMKNKLDDYVESMRAVKWTQVQRDIGKPAADKMGLSLDNKVEVRAHRAELRAR
jgi:hypothetical protein